jgi:membrane fusion protein, heavy metal efflux system
MTLNFKITAAISIILFALYGCNNDAETQQKEEVTETGKNEVVLTAESIKLVKIQTEPATMQLLTGFISLPATIVPNQDNEALVGSLVQGRVQRVYARIGDYVGAGQVLMTVEGLDIGTMKASFLKAKASLDFAKATYERQKKLFDEKIGSQKSLLESQAEYEKALAELKAEDKRIHSIGLTDNDILNDKTNDDHTSGTLQIKSPISGIVTERNVVIGQLVDATTNAFKIINTSSVWIDGQVFEKDLNKINQKTRAVFVTSIYPDEKFDGNIIYIAQSIDEHSRTLLIRGAFSNTQSKLKPQMFGELRLPMGENARAIMIPEEAIVKEAGLSYIFIKTSDTTFEQRIVITGSAIDNKVEIKDGLKESEIFVSKGVFYLKSELKKEELEGD